MKRNILFFIVLLILGACSTGTQLSTSKMSGEDLLIAGNYSAALDLYESEITKAEANKKDVNAEVYCGAGKAAFGLNDSEKAIAYFEEATVRQYADLDMYIALVKLYKETDNLSREIEILENIVSKYPDYSKMSEVKGRLLETTLESENWELAENLWEDLHGPAVSNAELIDTYLKINIAQKKEEKISELANQLIKLDAANKTALFVLGEQYFWKAENRYQKETKAYEKKKTRSQYAKLLKALDVVTADFKTSLGYFSNLYKQDPQKKYARFLGNIYARLNDKEKSIYYKNRAR